MSFCYSWPYTLLVAYVQMVQTEFPLLLPPRSGDTGAMGQAGVATVFGLWHIHCQCFAPSQAVGCGQDAAGTSVGEHAACLVREEVPSTIKSMHSS